MLFEGRKILVVLTIFSTLSIYLVSLTWRSSPFIDVWPLEGILWDTVVIIITITLLSYILFRSSGSTFTSPIIALLIQAFLVVIIPILKHPNSLNLIGPWDSVAHYSFAKWIIINGHVDTVGNVFYYDQYGYHPGNGIIPATLSLISSINLGWSMNAVLIAIYSAYMLLLLTALKTVEHHVNKNVNVAEGLWLVAIFMLAVNLLVYYGGVELGYIYAAGILYILVKWLNSSKVALIRAILTALLIFMGLILIHLSTAVIVVAYILITITALLITSFLGGIPKFRRISRGLLLLAVLIVSTFIVYEIYVDVILFSGTLRGALHRIYSLYIRELEVASKAVEVMNVTLVELLQYLISYYAKNIIVLGLIFIHTIALLLKWRFLTPSEKTVALLLFASYSTWLIGWAGVGSFLAGGRASSVICFLLALSIALTHKKLYGYLIKEGSLAIPLVLITLGFVANFGLPFMPTIKGGEDLFTYPTFSQGGFSDYALHPVTYISSYSTPTSPRFLCLHPYTAFGLCDLMWHTPRIPRHGVIAPKITSPEAIIEIIENYLGKNIMIPQPLRDRIIPGPIGYHDLYKKPVQFLLDSGGALVYNNGLYTVFLV